MIAAMMFLAQATPVQTWDFDSGMQGWTNSSSSATIVWKADGLPNPVGTTTPYVSGPNSLNYNNDVDYVEGTTSSGSATSPAYDISGLTSPTLTFQCCYQTESTDGSSTWDARTFEISNDNFATTLVSDPMGLTNSGATVGACAAASTWHVHTITLNPAWGTIRIRFSFDTVDGTLNAFAGLFVDDVRILAVGGGGGGGGTGAGNVTEGDNGDNGINDACGGSIRGGREWSLAILALLGLAFARRR